MADKHNHLLELVMFDIAYVISNCDYEYSSDEKKYLNVILDRYNDDDKAKWNSKNKILSCLEADLEKYDIFSKSFLNRLYSGLVN